MLLSRQSAGLAVALLPSLAGASELIITGVIDGPLSGGVPKAIELYAISNIADLSLYGVGSANNGGGTDGEEFTFPSVSVDAGTYLTVASESSGYTAYFGEGPSYTSSAASINGDDAIELFFNGAVVDVLGDINVDGNGESWEYLDGWAYRNSGSSPSDTFDVSEWMFSGPNALDGCTATTNSGCASVFPSRSFGGPPGPTPPAPPPTPPPIANVKIHDIQGIGPFVAIEGVVSVEAIVTSLFYSDSDAMGPEGFFIQEEDADADEDPNTSEGIYVYCGSGTALVKCASVVVGDLVQVEGAPGDFFGMSQINASTGAVTVLSSGQDLPTPTDLTLPASGSTKASTTFESVEGMLVRFLSTLAVSEYFQLARYGEIVLTETSRPYQFTHESAPDVAGYTAHLDALGSRRIILDDSSNDQNFAIGGASDVPYPFPTTSYPTGGLSLTNKFRGGDTIDGLTGVMHWSWSGSTGTDAWRIRPVHGLSYNFATANPAPTLSGSIGYASFKVASFNVLNYFTTLNERGANSEAELERQRAKIVAAMQGLDADVLGLIEIENSSNDEATIDLVGALNAAMGAGTYDYVATGSIGTDAIKVAFIYKPSTVALVGNYAILDSSVDDRFIDDKNRPALIQTFQQKSTLEKLTVAVNHFKSKGSSCEACCNDPNTGDGQANCAGVRADAALALADYLATDPTESNDPDFLIIGDLNAYKKETAITNLAAAGYVDLAEQFEGPNAYSYLFDGQLGYLDYALANSDLLTQVTGVSEWHVNADEIPLFDYNDCTQSGTVRFFNRESCANGDLYAPDLLRSSDHDPVIIGFNLGNLPNCFGQCVKRCVKGKGSAASDDCRADHPGKTKNKCCKEVCMESCGKEEKV